MGNLATGYYKICVWIMRLAYVNLLWIGFSLLGLGILGIFPASIAMFTVIRKWILGETDIPIFKTYLDAFKGEFIKANILGYLLLLIGFVLYIDLKFVRGQSGLGFTILQFGILVLFFIYFMVLLYIIPIFVHFKLTFIEYIKWSVVIGIVHPIVTVLIVAGVIAAYFLIFTVVPGLMLFFGVSAISFVVMWGSAQTFSKFEYTEGFNEV